MESAESGVLTAQAFTSTSLVKYSSGTSIAGKPMMCIYARRASAVSAAGSTRRRSSPFSASSARTRSRSGAAGRAVPPVSLGPVCVCLQGPILLTAPHGKEVWREGTWAWVRGITGRRLHRRELHTTELVLRMFDSTALRGQASVVVWNARCLKDARDGLDPNYLHSSEMPSSEWHQALHAFAKKYHGDPTGCVHFDIHGKKDRSGPCIDVGLEALRHHAPTLYDKVRSVIEARLGSMLLNVTPGKGGKRFGISFPGPNERDNGFWQKTEDGELQRPPLAPSTLVGQGSSIGLLSVQIELPKSLRSIVAASPRMTLEFALALSRIRTDLCNTCIPLNLAPACCNGISASSSNSNSQSDSADSSAAQAMVPVPAEAVPQVMSQLLRDAALLHLLDTERPI